MDSFTQLTKRRRSIRTFTEEALEQEQVVELMKTALMAPSSKTARPWDFVLVDDKELLRQIAECKPAGAQMLGGAALAIVVVLDRERSDVWIEDGSVASAMLLFAAESLGLGACWVQVRNRLHDSELSSGEYVKELLGIPPEKEVLSIVAVGHKAMERKEQNEDKLMWEKVHIGKW